MGAFMLVEMKKNYNKGELGIVRNVECINLNLKIIGIEYHDKFHEELGKVNDGVFDICLCGRYISLIQLSKKDDKSEMIFIDAANDYDTAFEAYNSLSAAGWPTKYKDRFMKSFEKLAPDYDKVYDSVELKLYSEFTDFVSSKLS
jgi:hypothetical protein